MAHSPSYWYDIMIAEKQTLSNLQDLQPAIDSSQQLMTDLGTSSKVVRWRLSFWIVATAAYGFELAFDAFIALLEIISQKSRFGTLTWYANKSLEYQHGDSLVWQNNNYEYPTLNPTAQIIKRVATQEAGPTVIIKVAKLSGSTPEKLTATEKTAFESYMNFIKAAGIVLNIISDDPDLLKLQVNVKFNPLVLSTTGELLSSPGTFPVNDAINAFIGNLPFNGVFELCDLVDSIQSATGVVAAYIPYAEAKYGAFPYAQISERYIPNAGYLVIDSTDPNALTINYNA